MVNAVTGHPNASPRSGTEDAHPRTMSTPPATNGTPGYASVGKGHTSVHPCFKHKTFIGINPDLIVQDQIHALRGEANNCRDRPGGITPTVMPLKTTETHYNLIAHNKTLTFKNKTTNAHSPPGGGVIPPTINITCSFLPRRAGKPTVTEEPARYMEYLR